MKKELKSNLAMLLFAIFIMFAAHCNSPYEIIDDTSQFETIQDSIAKERAKVDSLEKIHNDSIFPAILKQHE